MKSYFFEAFIIATAIYFGLCSIDIEVNIYVKEQQQVDMSKLAPSL